jgi:3-hydroxyisobutyrate dehydrogenase
MISKPRVAILGLGLMGTGMASRLLSQGFAVTVYNRSAAKAQALQQSGARVAATPREAADGAALILSMLADDVAARDVWLGNHGALTGAVPGTILIESSTVSVDWARELSAAAAKHGCELLDAPVTGSKPHAAAGALVFLVGGSAEALAAARPVLAAMSREIVHVGPSGSGAMMKLINNALCGVQAVALAEAIAFIERTGLDRDKAVGVLTNGAPGSPLVKLLSGRMLAKDYTPNFLMRLMAKDLRYALNQSGSEMIAAALRNFDCAIEAGLGEKDFSAVVELPRSVKKEK